VQGLSDAGRRGGGGGGGGTRMQYPAPMATGEWSMMGRTFHSTKHCRRRGIRGAAAAAAAATAADL
jgi:hypothetical protein